MGGSDEFPPVKLVTVYLLPHPLVQPNGRLFVFHFVHQVRVVTITNNSKVNNVVTSKLGQNILYDVLNFDIVDNLKTTQFSYKIITLELSSTSSISWR